MSPEASAAREDAASISQNLVNYFGQSTIHEGYQINMESNMPDEEALNYNILLLDFEKKERSLEEKMPLAPCFPPGFISISWPYAPQDTYFIEQMGGTKRSRNSENASAPVAKRRGATGSRGGKNGNSAETLRKSATKAGRSGKANQVFIDLSGEEDPVSGQIQPAEAIMKPLPPSLISGEFPQFNEGEVYIIIDSNNITYQYRIHKAVISHMSPMLAKLLQMPSPKEAMEKLKTAETDAEVRLELRYSQMRGLWMLSRAPFTEWKQAETLVKVADTEKISEEPVLSLGFNGDTMLPASQNVIPVDTIKTGMASPPPGVLPSIIVASEITMINVAKVTESDFSENGVANPSSQANGEVAPKENIVQLESMEEDRKPDATADSVSAKPEIITLISIDQTLVSPETVVNTVDAHLANAKADPDQLPVFPEDLKDEITPEMEVEDSNVPVPSSAQEEPQILGMISELGFVEDSEETSPLISENTSLGQLAAESEEVDDNSAAEAEKDDLTVNQSTPTLDGVHLSTEANPDQDLGKKDACAAPNLINLSRPPVEISEAYHNLFLVFYSKPPIISKSSISIALGQCDALILIAERLKCLPVIRPYLANAIVHFGKQLYLAITAEPFRWLKLSITLKSSAIYKESMIHIVGAYIPGPIGQAKLLQDMPDLVRDLILFKVRQLDQQRMDVNERLFTASIMVDSKTVAFSFADQSTLSTWLVVQIWRDWFCRNMASAHLEPSKTGELYRTLAKSGDAYLPIAYVKAAIEAARQPLHVDLDEIEEDLALLKKFAQGAVEDLCENNGMLDLQKAGVSYLTCTHIADEELPWFAAAE